MTPQVFDSEDVAIGAVRQTSITKNEINVPVELADWDEYFEALHDGAFDLIASPVQTLINHAHYEVQKTGTSVSAGKTHTVSAGGPV